MDKKQCELENKARDKIVEIAKDNGVYFVVWHQHFGKCFAIYKNISKKPPEIYSAMYESFYDLTKNDREIVSFNIDNDIANWQELLPIVMMHFSREISLQQ